MVRFGYAGDSRKKNFDCKRMNERLQVIIQYTYIKILTLEAPVMIAVRPAKEKDILIKYDDDVNTKFNQQNTVI